MKKCHLLLIFLLTGVVCFRFIPGAGEFYARILYPEIARVLSGLSSVVPLMLEELIVLASLGFLFAYPVYSYRKGKTGRHIWGREVEFLLWIYVWFYWGWGINYFRTDFYSRAGVVPASYEETRFRQFLTSYTDSLNLTFVPADETPSPEEAESEIKALYRNVPSRFGLSIPAGFHHPKQSLINGLYSRVGVMGYMGPFLAESYINKEMDADVFVYAHELSHWLGVSSEAEANFWAYYICLQSSCQAVRHRGYMGLFPYVWANASFLLSDDDFQSWRQTLRPEVLAAYQTQREKRARLYSPLLGNIQHTLYNWYLKGNRISSGQKNYAEVIGMILSLPADWHPCRMHEN